MKALGHDTRLVVMQDGRELVSFRTPDTIDIDDGLSSEEHNPVGAENAEISGRNDPAVLTITFEPDSPEYKRLIAAQRAANRPNAVRTALSIDITCSVDFGDGGRTRTAYEGCIMRSPRDRHGGRKDRLKNTMEFVCGAGGREI